MKLKRMQKVGHIATASAEGKYFYCKAFQLFPDLIKLDEEKLTITKRKFLHKQVITVQLEDLLNVEIFEAPLFCTVRVYSKYVTGGHVSVEYIRKNDAYELRKLVNNLMAEIKMNSESGGQ